MELMASRTQFRINAAERAEKALRLRAMRVPWDEIAKQCGYASKGAAYTAAKRELDKIPREAAKELRALELESLDVAERALARRLAQGDLQAIDRMIKIKRLRAEMTGLFENTADNGVEEVKHVLAQFLNVAVNELDDSEQIVEIDTVEVIDESTDA
jgi:uncharacterized membrane-anchored protein YjiN (DUF445 family)